MSHVCVLDCTLRDGAYLVDKEFGNEPIRGIIDGLVKANIDYIEIGFFQNDGFGEGKTVYRNSEDAMKYIPKDRGNSEFAVLADYSRFSIDNLDDRIPGGIDIVRECFFKHERIDALNNCKIIKSKGYKCFVQPVDILGYSDKELIELIEKVNEIEPYCISIVDTFGSMYLEDLRRLFELIDHNLASTIKVGFHSHNNMQMSNALSQEFVRITQGKREIVVDSTLSGMGRGAGNTPTELIVQYLVDKGFAHYDVDSLLDVIDVYMDNLRYRCSWGYSTEYFVAGAYGAHVNNISYLIKKNSIRSKDIRYILNKIGKDARKRYDYDLLEAEYIEMMNSQMDDTGNKTRLKDYISDREVLILAPGSSIDVYSDQIYEYVMANNPVVISINFIHDKIACDFLYMNNRRRYQALRKNKNFDAVKKIFTSNFSEDEIDDNTITVSFCDLIKCGWDSIDNSMLMLLRLLADIGVNEISIAGFDGYDSDINKRNYLSDSMEMVSVGKKATEINKEISEMLVDFNNTRRTENMNIKFITPSRFESILTEG